MGQKTRLREVVTGEDAKGSTPGPLLAHPNIPPFKKTDRGPAIREDEAHQIPKQTQFDLLPTNNLRLAT